VVRGGRRLTKSSADSPSCHASGEPWPGLKRTGSGDGSRFRLPSLARRASSIALRSLMKLAGLLFAREIGSGVVPSARLASSMTALLLVDFASDCRWTLYGAIVKFRSGFSADQKCLGLKRAQCNLRRCCSSSSPEHISQLQCVEGSSLQSCVKAAIADNFSDCLSSSTYHRSLNHPISSPLQTPALPPPLSVSYFVCELMPFVSVQERDGNALGFVAMTPEYMGKVHLAADWRIAAGV
jgi:hypothetical protein